VRIFIHRSENGFLKSSGEAVDSRVGVTSCTGKILKRSIEFNEYLDIPDLPPCLKLHKQLSVAPENTGKL
jgi:hypothetical protein